MKTEPTPSPDLENALQEAPDPDYAQLRRFKEEVNMWSKRRRQFPKGSPEHDEATAKLQALMNW